jgi:hypothetical protein
VEKRPDAKNVCINMDNNLKSITIETHFGIEGEYIKTITRNNCSEDLVEIIQEVARIIYPNLVFDVYFAPAETGSYRDIIKFCEKNKIGVATASVIAIGTLVIQLLNYRDDHKSHSFEDNKTQIETIDKCLELQKSILNLSSEFEVSNITEEKIRLICSSTSLIRRKNDIFNTLIDDETVKSNEFILKDSEDNPIDSQKVDRENFPTYIEAVPDNHYSEQNFTGVIELISPVFKQKKEGKGITWRGTFHGETIKYNDVIIIGGQEDIDFYMQDMDFKKRILDQEQSFKIGDTLKVKFEVSGEIKGGVISNRSIFVKEVESINEIIIPHTQKVQKTTNIISEDQASLF